MVAGRALTKVETWIKAHLALMPTCAKSSGFPFWGDSEMFGQVRIGTKENFTR
jgi:hypothetical protein